MPLASLFPFSLCAHNNLDDPLFLERAVNGKAAQRLAFDTQGFLTRPHDRQANRAIQITLSTISHLELRSVL